MTKSALSRFTLCTFIFFAATLFANDDIAIFAFDVASGVIVKEGVKNGIPHRLAYHLEETRRVRIADREATHLLVSDSGLPPLTPDIASNVKRYRDLLGVSYVITGSVLAYTYPRVKSEPSQIGVKVSVRIVDLVTGTDYPVITREMRKESAATFPDTMPENIDFYDTPPGRVTDDVLALIANDVIRAIGSPPLQGRVIKVRDEYAYINIGSIHGLAPGAYFALQKPLTNEGGVYETIGEGTVEEVFETYALLRVLSSAETVTPFMHVIAQ